VDVGQLIDERPLAPVQKLVIVLCGLVVLMDGYDIQTMALGVPSIALEWALPPSRFGYALSASLIGLMLGAGLLAPLGDKFGRRPLLVGGMALIGLGSLCTVISTTPGDLVLWRLITGLGLGASIPNGTALTSEYMPARRRAALVTLMFCNIALGAFAAGFTAPYLLDRWGWRGLFVAGGVFPLSISLLLLFAAPESLRFLAARRPNDERIAKLLKRLVPGTTATSVRQETFSAKQQSLWVLLVPQYRARTLLMWLAFAMNLFVLYALVSWIPSLLRGSGWSAADASRGVGIINGGGVVGGLLISWFVDRKKTMLAMLTAYVSVATSLALFTVLPSSALWWLLLLVIGAGTSGAQLTLNALAAALYPPVMRATGVGWAISMGRIGAVLAPVVGAMVVGHQLSTGGVLGLLILPVAASAASIAVLLKVMSAAAVGPTTRAELNQTIQ
jgi:AAHS family 4-hydroxybenzoate transporter-like MFS transporter